VNRGRLVAFHASDATRIARIGAEKGRRKRKHHQFLTPKQGLDHFRSQIITIMTLLRISGNKKEFKSHVRKLYSPQTEFNFENN